MSAHSCLDLELKAVSDWVSDWSWYSGVSEPSLVGTIVAVPEDDSLVVDVSGSNDIQALLSVDHDDVSVGSPEEVHGLETILTKGSEYCWSSDSGSISPLVGESESSVVVSSDRSGSGIKDVELVCIFRVVGPDDELILSSSNISSASDKGASSGQS